jgi:hypothetical protein
MKHTPGLKIEGDLRDWFAAMALTTACIGTDESWESSESMTAWCYEVADKMLEARTRAADSTMGRLPILVRILATWEPQTESDRQLQEEAYLLARQQMRGTNPDGGAAKR